MFMRGYTCTHKEPWFLIRGKERKALLCKPLIRGKETKALLCKPLWGRL